MAKVEVIEQQENSNRPPTLGEGTPAPNDIRRVLRQRRKRQWDAMSTGEQVRSVAQAGVRPDPRSTRAWRDDRS